MCPDETSDPQQETDETSNPQKETDKLYHIKL